MNVLIISSLLSFTSLLYTGSASAEKAMTNPKDTTFSEPRIKFYPMDKKQLKAGLSIDPNFPVARMKADSKMPIARLKVNSKMPIARLEEYIPPAQQLQTRHKSDSVRRDFKWIRP